MTFKIECQPAQDAAEYQPPLSGIKKQAECFSRSLHPTFIHTLSAKTCFRQNRSSSFRHIPSLAANLSKMIRINLKDGKIAGAAIPLNFISILTLQKNLHC